MILVLSHAGDVTASRVEAVLERRRAAFLRYDTALFPARSTITAAYGDDAVSATLRLDGASGLDLARVESIWYRHPGPFQPVPGASGPDRAFAVEESGLAVGGLLRGLDCAWMNHPAAIVEARYKLTQLRLAQRFGLAIPRTLVTNEPEAARDFVSSCDGAVIKVLGNPVARDERGGIVFTSDVSARDMQDAEAVKQAPCLFQEKVPKRMDLRAVVVDERILCAEIESQALPESSTDYRRRVRWLKHAAVELPTDVQASLLRLVRAFDLRFAAVDMAVTPEGRYVFFELNANGQWMWLEEMAGLQIAEAIAHALIAPA
jgi:glutathione synthase/RimK-type ligase-like ATP-grasp enzyme